MDGIRAEVGDAKTMNLASKATPSSVVGGIGKAKKPADNKTVSFGDASSVHSKPLWSLFAFLLLMAIWYVSTHAWGLPGDVIDEAKASAQASEDYNGRPVSDKDFVTACNASDACSRDDYQQLVKPTQFPTPRDTWNGLITVSTTGFRNITIWEHTRVSLWRVARGMFFGSLFGIPIGLGMGLSSRFKSFFDTPVELFRPIPPLALIPLAIAFFGLGDQPAVMLLIFASLWIMIIAARAGAQAVNLSKVRAAYSLGANKRQILMRVVLPNALPELFTGFRVALGVSWGTLVAAELIGTKDGLGSMIFAARQFFRTDVMVVGIVFISILGVLMDLALRFLEARLIPWRGKS